MGIRLDEADEERGSEPDVSEQRDAARSAVQAVQYWEEVLRQRVSETEALDGWVASAVSTLLGTRAQQIEDAVARVQQARTHLAAARAAAEQAKRALLDAEGRHRAARDAEVDRVMRLEMRADALRGSTHPLARELDEIELAIDAARTEHELLQDATGSGSALLARLGNAGTHAQKGATSAILDLGDMPFAGLAKLSRFHEIHRSMNEVIPRARRFERACAAIGMPVELDFGDIRAPSMALDLVSDGLLADLYSLDRVQDVQHRIDAARDEVRGILEPVEQRQRALTDELRALEARRAALLDRPDG